MVAYISEHYFCLFLSAMCNTKSVEEISFWCYCEPERCSVSYHGNTFEHPRLGTPLKVWVKLVVDTFKNCNWSAARIKAVWPWIYLEFPSPSLLWIPFGIIDFVEPIRKTFNLTPKRNYPTVLSWLRFVTIPYLWQRCVVSRTEKFQVPK